ncbi:hypothetical protein [Pygmaiobacter massiliensis]|uniref:hypothetical protein n=1 Tax=Pygmaiobacter massiliensis TaxID=1917873 RepID=UPI00289C68C8|nr:hypothetical protein [Pygmaiobacter massiliensis]
MKRRENATKTEENERKTKLMQNCCFSFAGTAFILQEMLWLKKLFCNECSQAERWLSCIPFCAALQQNIPLCG